MSKSADHPPPKMCLTCGREITWRKKWERSWPEIRYCSSSCRSGLQAVDRALEAAILGLLAKRPAAATICPFDAARLVDPVSWADLKERARRAARRLAVSGNIVITQDGRAVDPSTAKGRILLRKK